MQSIQFAWALFAALCVMQLLDIWSTRKILRGGGRELNPAMDWLMRLLGVMPALFLMKALVVALFAGLLFALRYAGEHQGLLTIMVTTVLGAACLLYAAVLRHNWRSL